MPIILHTVNEALRFLDSFDGYGMISTDENLQIERLRNFNLAGNCPPRAADDPAARTARRAITRYGRFARKIKIHRRALNEFIERELKDKSERDCEDFRSHFSNEIDVQFYVCDDPRNPNYRKREVWAYPIIENSRGERVQTDETVSVLVAVVERDRLNWKKL